MSRTNLLLLGVLAVVAGAWLLARDSGAEKTTGPSPRLFPEFNKEAADRIVIEGGWKGQRYEIALEGSEWKLASAAGYPVKKEEARKFLDAVNSLRRDANVGNSAAVRKETWTDDEVGRLVTVFRGEEPMAAFRLGKNPKAAWQEFFVREAEKDDVYRTRTILSESAGKEPAGGEFGPSGFDWHNYTNSLFKWCDTKIWDLWDWDVVGIKLVRPDLKATITKKGEEDWEVAPEEGEPFQADVSAVEDIASRLKSLSFEEVVGGTEGTEALAEYDLDRPDTITVLLTVRKKAEKKPEEAKPEEEKKEEGEEGEKKEEEKKEPETVTETRFLTVGKKVEIPKRFNDGDAKPTTEAFYAIMVGGDGDAEAKKGFVYLVNDYKVGGLRKTLDELRAKEKKEEKKEDSGEKQDEGCGEEKKAEEPPADDPGGEKEGCGEEEEGCGEEAPPGGGDEEPPGEDEQPK